MAMLVALAYIVGFFIRIRFMPGAQFLTYDPKDIIIVLGGLMFGPLSALIMSVSLAFLEMITHSDSGPIGMLMNALGSAALACPAAFVYQQRRTMVGAISGIVVGILVVVPTMLLWNYIMVPIYMTGVTREAVTGMLVPIFLPFNLIKASLNGAVVLIIYKPITDALKAARLLDTPKSKGKWHWGLMLTAAFIVLSLILLMIVM